MDFYFECYSELSLQRFMVSDKPRTDAFAEAIKEVVKGGERVLDIGTGTGLLAMLAAKAGASSVYALDHSDIAKVAKVVVENNHLEDKVEVIQGHASEFQLSEPVDLIVSEWLGHFAFVESMLDDVIDCRDQNLSPEGSMLPSGVEVLLAPIDSPLLYDDEGPGQWIPPVHGIDFSCLEELEVKQAIAIKTTVAPYDLLAPGQPIISVDLKTATKDHPYQAGEVSFTMQRDGRLDGFAGWFVAQLSPSVKLDTGPDAPTTHWQQSFLAIEPFDVAEGQVITVRYYLSKHPADRRSVELKLSVEEQSYNYTIG
ncbi:50S ribosomal protein L11 methyltransferase [Pelagicoccus sp. SDUM812003]|uniref:50S ribosomal protein L11 methyltransferase n=1 Tax=Pelagicoccus sp. SDUM812003 TaxID=3041267 RepID=UPI00280F0A5C|nr:50S ribosomal protein L11 methyltransferase [Pelagicoccus sp. SDUM812003]MDQ8204081.1 50S ribosomal protein L11 methyltransferase [Pelagicoccus sp. SDUM812003]